MVNYPDVMQKAQAELDSVVGRERPPTFDDADALPYIRAIVQETLRWRPVSPLSMLIYYDLMDLTEPSMIFQLYHM